MSWEEQGSPLSTTSLYVALKTYLTKAFSLPFIDTVWLMAVAKEFSMPRKALSWYLSKQERREKEVFAV